MRLCPRLGCFIGLVLVAACGGTPRGATDVALAKARDQASHGADLFKQHCAPCHGERGEGATAPAILGAGALPEFPREHDTNTNPMASDPELMRAQALSRPAGAAWRDPFHTADDLYRFVSTQMPRPKEKMGTLKADDYWAVVNFMLVAHGAKVPAGGVTPANASSVQVPPE
jgi:hypothetical protein